MSEEATAAGSAPGVAQPVEDMPTKPLDASAAAEAIFEEATAPPAVPDTRPPQDPLSLFGEVSIPLPGLLQLGGVTYASAKTAQLLLNENHLKFHWAFNDDGFHNHLSHHVLAAYSLGATPQLLQAIYETHACYQRPLPPLQTTITESSFDELLGQTDAYSSYLAFFTSRIESTGVLATVERYLFTQAGQDLLVRLLSGAIHPMIQLGYGLEFGLPALAAEGLAWAACHSPLAVPLFEPDFIPPTKRSASISISHLASRLTFTARPPESFAATSRRIRRDRPREPAKGLSGFTIMDHVLRDPELQAGKANAYDDASKFGAAVKNAGWRIRQWADEWVVDEEGGFEELVAKAEELLTMATVIFAAASRPGLPVKLDFFLMHGLTSALFLPSYIETLSHANCIRLLRAHFRVLLGYWVSRGTPRLFIRETLMDASAHPHPPNTPTHAPGAIATDLLAKSKGKGRDSDSPTSPTRPIDTSSISTDSDESPVNPWLAIIASAMDHPDEHLTKVIRSLYFASTILGHAPPGYWRSPLAGTEMMDGSIFVRAAGMVMDTMGWAREDKVLQEDWSRVPLGFDKAWE